MIAGPSSVVSVTMMPRRRFSSTVSLAQALLANLPGVFLKGPALGFRTHELLEFLGLTHGWRSFWRKSGFTGYAQSSLIEVRAPVLDLVPRPTERPTQIQLAAR